MIRIFAENFLSLKYFMAYILKTSHIQSNIASETASQILNKGREQVKFKTWTYSERRGKALSLADMQAKSPFMCWLRT